MKVINREAHGFTSGFIDGVSKQICCRIYTGTLPALLITDPDMIKEIFIKEYQTLK
jgi:hypothetical protein